MRFLFFIILLSSSCSTLEKHKGTQFNHPNVKNSFNSHNQSNAFKSRLKPNMRESIFQNVPIVSQCASIFFDLNKNKKMNFIDSEHVKLFLEKYSGLKEHTTLYLEDRLKNFVSLYNKKRNGIEKPIEVQDLLKRENLAEQKENNDKKEISILQNKLLPSLNQKEIVNENAPQKTSLDSKAIVKKETDNVIDINKKKLEKENLLQKKQRELAFVDQNSYSQGEDLFSKGIWKQAITKFSNYRKQNPRGLHRSKATLRIAEAFQNMKLYPESYIFLKEVLRFHPDSPEAKKAKIFLKNK